MVLTCWLPSLFFCSGGKHFMASNNDGGVREYDMEKFQLMNHFRFPWPVNVSCFTNLDVTMQKYSFSFCLNKVSFLFFISKAEIWFFFCAFFLLWMQHSSLSPDCKLIAVVGDHLDGLVVDSSNGKVRVYSRFVSKT